MTLTLLVGALFAAQLHLFVDDSEIQSLEGARLELHHPQPQETVLTFDKPWEGPVSAYHSVFKDGAKYRCYYRGLRDEKSPEVTCTAESSDGIHWTKPELGTYEVLGSKANNVVWTGDGTHNFAPFLDLNPAAKPDEKYKAVGGDPKLSGFSSPDGYHWKRVQDDPILTDGKFDSLNIAFWHPTHKRYECFLRDFKDGVRTVRMATSDDFIHWSVPVWFDFGATPAEHLYTNAIVPYFREPSIYLGFPKRFVPARTAVKDWEGGPGISDGVFMSSRDGVHWNRWREAFIRPGLDPNNWTERNMMTAWGLLELAPGEISLYYMENYRHPACRLRRATLRTDGFVSVNAGAKGGSVVTKPFAADGSRLVVNFATSAAGSLRCELQDADGRPIPGYELGACDELFGDDLERAVTWGGKSDLGALTGKTVRLKATLADADLYSFRLN
ncbi:MAG: hypothetical protein HZB26_03035 [Candidatus Hydrogenedentes bacterium]|nr:hypothetical protein [Candidatus Hydrogenedentota bacterium]